MTPKTAIACLLHLLAAGPGSAGGSHLLPLDRPYTSRNSVPALTEREISRQIRSEGPMSFILPRPCLSRLDSSQACDEPGGYDYRDSARGIRLSILPLAAYETRAAGETIHAFEAGGLVQGGTGPLSFFLDGRMFTELHEDPDHRSFDREFVERQNRASSGSIVYSSYSRYRSNLAGDFPWGRLAVSRDAAHWGPGLLANLAFNQAAVPFNQATWAAHLGPLSVLTLYGRLDIHGDSLGTLNKNRDSRSLYAHRYEWRAGSDVLIGISEQLVLYEQEEPFAFAPIVPLFILKGSGREQSNNGNIAVDAAWRLPGMGLVYGEFLIDDIQSPTSLFDDNWANKWAWMAGLHGVLRLPRGDAGLVLEYSRVEPWVYTHHAPATAQSANSGHPLGNPMGPNSRWLAIRPYFRGMRGWYLSVQADLVWKGRDPGSSLDDVPPDTLTGKTFLAGVGGPRVEVGPRLSYAWKSVVLETAGAIGGEPAWSARIHWQPRGDGASDRR